MKEQNLELHAFQCQLDRIVMPDKSCNKCKFLKKYTSEDGESWMNVCEGEEPDWEDDGLYHVTVVDTEEFDASHCLNFLKA